MKKMICLVVFALLLLLPQGVLAAENNIIVESSESTVFVSYSSGIGIQSGYILCSSRSVLTDYYNQSITTELQKLSGGSWYTVKDWYNSGYELTLYVSVNHPGFSGTYRVKSTHSAGGETWVSYSPIRTI